MRIPHLGTGTEGVDPRITAVQYFVDRGMTPYGAIGLVGNLYRESNLRPDTVNRYSGAYGIAQWLGDRKKALFEKYGDAPTYEQLLEYVWNELNSTHKRGRDMLNGALSIKEAAEIGFGNYEFSAGLEGAIRAMNNSGLNGQASVDKGIEYANDIYKLYAPIMMGKPITPESARRGPRQAMRPTLRKPVSFDVKPLTPPTPPVVSTPEPALAKPNKGKERRRSLFQSMMEMFGLNDMFGS